MVLTNQEQPLSTLHQVKKRAILPQILSVLVLSFIFYLGIIINISLLELTAKEETILKVTALVLLLLINTLGFSLAFYKASLPYLFYANRIAVGRKQIGYDSIVNTSPQKRVLDRIFKTYYLQLSPQFVIKNIPEGIALEEYIKQMQEYNKMQ